MITEIVVSACILCLVWRIYQNGLALICISETDGLTGIGNRLKFQADIVHEIHRANRMKTDLILAFMDIDNFKTINDQFGHMTGDQVLNKIATLLRHSIRTDVDTCYRIGGDEFAILMPLSDSRSIEGIETKRIEELRCNVATTLKKYSAGLSIGIVELKPNEPPEHFIHRADMLMYKEKDIKKKGQSNTDKPAWLGK